MKWVIVMSMFLSLACDKREPRRAPVPPGPRYFIVGKQATQTLDHNPRTLLPGFGVVVTEQWVSAGERIGRTSLGRQVAMKDLRPASPSRFAGVHEEPLRLDFGWVVKDAAPVLAEPIEGKPIARKPHYARLSLQTSNGPQGYFRVAEGWMPEADLRVPRLSPRPAEVGDTEAWIDVDLRTQTLVAYRGDVPVFATMVATGVGADGTAFATPKGIHHVRAKLLAATMDNLEHTGVAPYSYEEVPFTQYIGRVALHGAFWHDQFGIPRSHGCINLSLADAEWLFAFSKPALPDGEKEVSAKTGTVVRVR
jgi:lipoprotein-anchoring transpeptidase ErfK/SrfK